MFNRFQAAMCALWGMLTVGLLVAGCGGGGHSSNTNEPPVALQRHWAGPWHATDNSQTGSYDFTITSDGKVTGTSHNTTYNLDGAVNGQIDSAGNYTDTYVYSGAQYSSKGTAHVDTATGHLIFTDDNYDSSGTKFLTIIADMTAQ